MPTNFAPSVQTVSVTTGGKSQVLVAASSSRQSVMIQPQTEACLINFGATAGLQAAGYVSVDVNPSNNETIVINGVTFTFVSGASTATNVHIGASNVITATNLAAVLTASANSSINICTYTTADEIVNITAIAGGTGGNAYTLAVSSGGNVSRSGATLSGGSNTQGGIALALNQALDISAAPYGSIKQDIYVVSVTTAAKISYLEGNG